jgi:hypothetical protein
MSLDTKMVQTPVEAFFLLILGNKAYEKPLWSATSCSSSFDAVLPGKDFINKRKSSKPYYRANRCVSRIIFLSVFQKEFQLILDRRTVLYRARETTNPERQQMSSGNPPVSVEPKLPQKSPQSCEPPSQGPPRRAMVEAMRQFTAQDGGSMWGTALEEEPQGLGKLFLSVAPSPPVP